ncbi:MAG: hypothetical protein GTO22_20845 [Gemmatimonadales bacterium]|nr:hypothetical protein [Gemmatimonadales bacterium]
MALVRCPTHKIPYNDENPRGCPACARERDGGDQAALMRELARMSQAVQKPAEATAPPKGAAPPKRPPVGTLPTVTARPRRAPPEEPRPTGLLAGRRKLTLGVIVIGVLAIIVFATSGPRFVREMHPPPASQQVRPLPIEPGALVTVVFAALGTQAPHPVPDAPRLARYSYGSELEIDAINRVVYAITFSSPSRSWRGLQVGMSEQNARGQLALLGTPRDDGPASMPDAQTIGNYMTYRSLETRPRRTLRAEVRPPNGCFDALVDLRPRVIGFLLEDDRRRAVVGEGDAALDWAVTRIRIVNRSIPGPYADGIAC